MEGIDSGLATVVGLFLLVGFVCMWVILAGISKKASTAIEVLTRISGQLAAANEHLATLRK
ncbi:MAG: hypothetical protein ABSF45_23845 [Terriglobia bacterium]|jgi:uncharacterized membrane protein YciS (DUF1049 family)